MNTTTEEHEPTGPSREEIETLCLLHALGDGERRLDALAKGLGLSTALAPFLAGSLEPLVELGLVENHGERYWASAIGRDFLDDRLAALGIRR